MIALQDHNPTQTRLLAEIGRQENTTETVGPQGIADKLELDQGTVSRKLKRMAEDGWIQRDPPRLLGPGHAILAAAPPVLIPHHQLDPNPDNPRRLDLTSAEERQRITDLAESIAEQGQRQSILVRPVRNGVYEIVAGERRYRAMAELIHAGRLPEDHPVKAEIRPMSDAQALLAALTENMARQDMNPMDEGDGLLRLYQPRVDAAPEGGKRKAQADAVDFLAKATGQSIRYVQQRIKLAKDLIDPAKQAVREGRLDTTRAELLSGWAFNDQPHALAQILAGGDGWQSVADIRARKNSVDAAHGVLDRKPATPETRPSPAALDPDTPVMDGNFGADPASKPPEDAPGNRETERQSPAAQGGKSGNSSSGEPPVGGNWKRDGEAASATDRQVLHEVARAVTAGAIRITIDADPLARSVAAELLARIESCAEDGAVRISTGGNRAILKGAE